PPRGRRGVQQPDPRGAGGDGLHRAVPAAAADGLPRPRPRGLALDAPPDLSIDRRRRPDHRAGGDEPAPPPGSARAGPGGDGRSPEAEADARPRDQGCEAEGIGHAQKTYSAWPIARRLCGVRPSRYRTAVYCPDAPMRTAGVTSKKRFTSPYRDRSATL